MNFSFKLTNDQTFTVDLGFHSFTFNVTSSGTLCFSHFIDDEIYDVYHSYLHSLPSCPAAMFSSLGYAFELSVSNSVWSITFLNPNKQDSK